MCQSILSTATQTALDTKVGKVVGNQTGEIQENGASLGNSEIVETDGSGKFITASKNTAYNKVFAFKRHHLLVIYS